MEKSSAHEWLTLPLVSDQLGISPSQVRRLVEDRALLARQHNGQWLVPAVLIQDGAPLNHLAGTATLLVDGGFSEDGALEWLLEDNGLLGCSPATALSQGRKTEVRRIAQTLAL
ncbi:MAG: Rv2175c family DNA-binding protein [Pontimonas sp.]